MMREAIDRGADPSAPRYLIERYEHEEVACFCGSSRGEEIVAADRYGYEYHLLLCKECGLLYQSPRMTHQATHNFYSSGEYRAIYGDSDEAVPFCCSMKPGASLLEFLDHFDVIPGSVVEIGAGGHPLIPGSIELDLAYGEMDPGEACADLVVMNHVLEHCPDIEAELENVKRILKPDGFLFVAVPGTYSWQQSKLWQNAHCYQFTADSLAYVMECCGFEEWYSDEIISSLWRPRATKRSRQAPPRGEPARVRQFLIDGKRQLPAMRTACKFPLRERRRLIDQALARGLPDVTALLGTRRRPAALIAAGPTIDTQIDTLRSLDADIYVVERMQGWCRKHGIRPDFVVAMDPSEGAEESFRELDHGATYLLHFQCSPEIFDLVKGAPNVFLFQTEQQGVDLGELWDKYGYDAVTMVRGAGSVLLASAILALSFGSRDLHIFGFDCSIGDGKQYAEGVTAPGFLPDQLLHVSLDGRDFVTTAAYLSFAQQLYELLLLARNTEAINTLSVYGEGLARAMAAPGVLANA